MAGLVAHFAGRILLYLKQDYFSYCIFSFIWYNNHSVNNLITNQLWYKIGNDTSVRLITNNTCVFFVPIFRKRRTILCQKLSFKMLFSL